MVMVMSSVLLMQQQQQQQQCSFARRPLPTSKRRMKILAKSECSSRFFPSLFSLVFPLCCCPTKATALSFSCSSTGQLSFF